jgi:hypothetical protein
MSRAWIIAALLALIGAAYAFGRFEGARHERNALQADVAAAMRQAVRNAELVGRKEQERLALEAERDALARDLEDQAYAQQPAGVCLPADRVRRLDLR